MVNVVKTALFGQPLALLTQHGKEALLAPLLEPALGCRLVHVNGIDTDTLGTFTRDIPRAGSQREAARRKASLGAELAGCRFALASEGAFSTDPWTGMMPWNLEMVMLRDEHSGLEVVGIGQGAAMNHQQVVTDMPGVLAFAERAGFPEHHLVVRPDHADHPAMIKGIATGEQLRAAFQAALAQSQHACVFVENDLRAHANPTRQAVIVKAARNLLERLDSLCPRCLAPDFWVSEAIPGLPCRWCETPTAMIKAEKWACPTCLHEEIRPREGEPFADPARCPECNP